MKGFPYGLSGDINPEPVKYGKTRGEGKSLHSFENRPIPWMAVF